jgi:integrase
MTLGEAFDRYLALKARKKTVDEDARNAKLLLAEFGKDTPLSDLTASRVSAYREARLKVRRRERPLSPAAINRPLALLRHMLRLAAREWDAVKAVPYIGREKERQGRLRWLTTEEAARLLEACRASRNAALVDLVELALYTGMRQSELLGLTWDRVDRSRGVVLLEDTKSDRRREIPLNTPADAVLARRWKTEAAGLVFPADNWNAYRSAWERAFTLSKVPDFRFHDLRHTFASWSVQRGATLHEVKDLLGHHSLAMVLRYAHLAPENLRSAVSRLDGVLAAAAQPQHNGSTTAAARDTEGVTVARNPSV